jgi:hypothetical protein
MHRVFLAQALEERPDLIIAEALAAAHVQRREIGAPGVFVRIVVEDVIRVVPADIIGICHGAFLLGGDTSKF